MLLLAGRLALLGGDDACSGDARGAHERIALAQHYGHVDAVGLGHQCDLVKPWIGLQQLHELIRERIGARGVDALTDQAQKGSASPLTIEPLPAASLTSLPTEISCGYDGSR